MPRQAPPRGRPRGAVAHHTFLNHREISEFTGSEFPSSARKRDRLDTMYSHMTSTQGSIPYQQLVEESSGEGVCLSREEEFSLGSGEEKESVEAATEEENHEEKRPSLTL